MIRKIARQMKKVLKSSGIIIIFCAFILLFQAYKHDKERRYLYNSNAIMSIHFMGVENLFHARYEYYAIGINASCKIPPKKIIKYFGETETERFIQGTNYNDIWNVSLYHSGGEEYSFYEDNVLETSYGDQYKITYLLYYRPGKERVTTSEEKQKIVQITEKLYESELIETISDNTERIIINYETIRNDDRWYVITGTSVSGKTLLRFTDKGELIKLLEIPDGFVDGSSLYFYNPK